MNKPSIAVILVVSLTFFSHSASVMNGSLSRQSVTLENKQRGVSWVASRSVNEDDFRRLAENNVNWIAQTPFGWQQEYNSPTLTMARGGRVRWGERDQGIETTARMAKKFGIKTLLKPHIWLRSRANGKWRLDIAMENEADWQSWFESYRRFIVHYAHLAERNEIEALSIGTELHETVKQRPDDWREIISAVRAVYSGQITYSANWYEEFQQVAFWDQLDFIGIQAYFPLTDNRSPSVAELTRGWQLHVEAIEKIQRQYGKPILFTEIGYKTTTDGGIKPWEWGRSRSNDYSEQAIQTQANCYEAFFQTFWDQDWFAGSYFWKWFPQSRRQSRRGYDPFTPQGHPAEKVMAEWYGQLP
jgi:hypothetical protein